MGGAAPRRMGRRRRLTAAPLRADCTDGCSHRPPKLEGNIAVGEGRQLGFAEFGDPQGRAVFWLHGTPAPVARSRWKPGCSPSSRASG
jgi:hypothetical protein